MMTTATPMSDLRYWSVRAAAPRQMKGRKLATLPVRVCVAIGLAGLIACGTGATMPVKSVATISVTLSRDPLIVPDSTTASATLRDDAGNTLSNRVVAWSSSDTTIATVSARGTVQAVRSGSAIIRASSENVTGSAGLTIIPPSAGIIGISRDAGSTAGGVVVQLTGSGFAAGDPVTFGGTPATGVTLLNATTLQATVPPGSPGPVNVTVMHNGAALTLTNGFTYWPAPTTSVAADFESGSVSAPFSIGSTTGGTATIVTNMAHTGTHSVLTQVGQSTGGAAVKYDHVQSEMMASTGWYCRFYVLIPAASLANTANSGQIKLYLSRLLTGSGQPGYFMLGEGSQFNSNNNSFASRIDYGVQAVATTPIITPDVWHEIEVYQYRDTVAHMGTSRVWYDGKLQGAAVNSMLGDDNSTEIRETMMGLVYTQLAAAYPLQVYVDDVMVANGFINPTP